MLKKQTGNAKQSAAKLWPGIWNNLVILDLDLYHPDLTIDRSEDPFRMNPGSAALSLELVNIPAWEVLQTVADIYKL
jgi:hypothetical protein